MRAADWTIIISAVATAVTAIVAIGQKIYEQHSNNKQQNFENYHKLVERINKSIGDDEGVYVQIQQAALYELRNYKKYKDISKYILEYWADKGEYADVVNDTLKSLKLGRKNNE